jgi:integrase
MQPKSVAEARTIAPPFFALPQSEHLNGVGRGEIDQLIDGDWLLVLSGCRLGEIVNLKWSEIDAKDRCLRLSDSKEGASVRPVGQAFFDHIATIKRSENCAMVLPPARFGKVFLSTTPASLGAPS